MVDEDTGLIEEDIPTVLTYLFTNYGKVTSVELKEQESEVLSIQFSPADPMIGVFRPIEALKKKAVEAELPYTEPQLLEFGLTIIRNTRDFEKAIGEWNSTANKTWTLFKTHYRDAQVELKEIRAPTTQHAGYHHANMLASQMRAELSNQQAEMLAVMQSMVPPDEAPAQEENEQANDSGTNAVPTQQMANAVIADNVQLQMLRILQSMQESQQNSTGNNGGGEQNGGGRVRVNRRTPDSETFNRRDTTKYCQTHGACNHTSSECNRKAPGHKNMATIPNRMGGSNAFCDHSANE